MKYDCVSERTASEVRITSAADLLPILDRYANKKQEHFIVISLDSAHQVIRAKIVSIGTVNRTIVHPREVFTGAIRDMAVAVIVAHNHPSGKLEPSTEDIAVTKRLMQAGEILGIQMLDHIIFGRNNRYRSLSETGELSR
jgi:DNA repair protein RadC